MCLGIPGQIEKIIDKAKFLGEVSVSGLRRPVNLACLQNLSLIHISEPTRRS